MYQIVNTSARRLAPSLPSSLSLGPLGPVFLTTAHCSLATVFPAFLTTNHYPLTTASTHPPMPFCETVNL